MSRRVTDGNRTARGRVFLVSSFLAFSLAGCFGTKTPPPAPETNDGSAVEQEDWTGVETTLSITSAPSGANVSLSTGEKCKTPCAVKRRLTENFDVTVEKSGFRPKTVSVVSHMNVVPGSGTTGKLKLSKPKLVPNPIAVTLEPQWDR